MAKREELERLINEMEQENIKIARSIEYHMKYVRDKTIIVQEVERQREYARNKEGALKTNNNTICHLKEELELLLVKEM